MTMPIRGRWDTYSALGAQFDRVEWRMSMRIANERVHGPTGIRASGAAAGSGRCARSTAFLRPQNNQTAIDWVSELKFYIQLDTKQVILETLFTANLLA